MAADVGIGAKEIGEDGADVGSGVGGGKMGVHGKDAIRVDRAKVG